MDLRLIAFYLPQFHPIPENDEWWGKGFTEWTNVTKATPLFRGHHQPNLPSDLGFYDLRVPEVRASQAELAGNAGIEGFCYWHYWFGNGKKLLQLPLEEVVKSKEPGCPFCVAWANETWTGRWHGLDSKILQEQVYPGREDIEAHFDYLLDAFSDDRYMRVNGKPIFTIYHPELVVDLELRCKIFRELATKHGLGGMYILGYSDSRILDPNENHLDGLVYSGFSQARLQSRQQLGRLSLKRNINRLRYLVEGYPVNVFDYKSASKAWLDYPEFEFEYFPVVFPNWDNSPRCGKDSVIVTGSTPELFETHLHEAGKKVIERSPDKRIVFIKSWNEWAEGNYLEPDRKFGHGYLDAVRRVRFPGAEN